MIALVIVVVLLVVGAFLLMRGTSKSPDAPPTSPEESKALRDLVATALRDRLPGWEVKTPEEEPLEVDAVETATERSMRLDLTELARGWTAAKRAGREDDAADLVEDLVRGVTGEDAEDEAPLDHESATSALALALVRPADAPKHALTRPVGDLVAILVLRHPAGLDALGKDDLGPLGLDEGAAFARAYGNLAGDVDDGLDLEPVDGDFDHPRVVQVAPGDRVAASYALVPGLEQALRKRLGEGELRLHLLASSGLFAAKAEVDLGESMEIEGDRLVPKPLRPGELAWQG